MVDGVSVAAIPDWVVILIKSAILLLVVVTTFAYAMLAERKVRADAASSGPESRRSVGIDAAGRRRRQTDLKGRPHAQDGRSIHLPLAPFISLLTAFSVYAIIPFGASSAGTWAIGNVNAGILFLLAITSLGVYGISLGWLGLGIKVSIARQRALTAQMISYELGMSLSLIGVLILAGTTQLDGIVNAQATWWFIGPQFVGFIIYVITAVAETNRVPFDLVEAETELVAGFHTEYSGLRFGLFFIAEYVNMLTVSCIAIAPLFRVAGMHRSVLPDCRFRASSGSSSRLQRSCSSICGCAPRCRAFVTIG